MEVPDEPQSRLQTLIDRWQVRHQRRMASGRRPADAEREARATALFPWRTETPADYVARHGADMIGYTYDAYTYADRDLEAWLHELGEILRQRARGR